MGIESLSGVTGAASYQNQTVQATKPVQQAAPSEPKDNNVAETSQSAATNEAVVIGQATESNGNSASNSNNEEFAKKKEKEASLKELKDIQKVLNNNTIAEFGYNEPTKRITIKIKDKDTDEVIKEIPSDKALDMLARAWELAGMMVDERR